MPSVSFKQHKFMEAAAHNPSFAKQAGVPVSVAQEFVEADKRSSNYKTGRIRTGKRRVGGSRDVKEMTS